MINRYFAYGSNMNSQRVIDRGIDFLDACSGSLSHFELVFNKASRQHPRQAHANIRRKSHAAVEGVVYLLSEPEEILKMDPYERAPINYGRDVVWVETEQGGVWAWTYFANSAVLVDGLLPPPAYMAHLLEGAPFLSPDYLTRLKAWRLAD